MIVTTVDMGHLLRRLRKVPRETARIMQIAVEADAKGFVADVVNVTPPFYRPGGSLPPSMAGKKPSKAKLGKEALRRGEKALSTDVRRVYGHPSLIYDAIKGKDLGRAKSFWAAYKLRDWRACDQLCDAAGVPRLRDFLTDDGDEHRKRRNRRTGRVVGKKPSFFVRQPKGVNAYIVGKKRNVGLLASGFKAAATKFGVKLPKWISRHSGSLGSVNVTAGSMKHMVVVSNSAPWASNADLTRRIRWVLASEKRKKRLEYRLRAEIRAAMKRSAMQVV